MKPMKRILYTVLQLTWGLPQTLLGFAVFLKNYKEPHSLHRYAIHTTWKRDLSGVSLGLFIFTGKGCTRDTKDHEFGHSIQSLILGPLYLPLIGLPSLLWNRNWRKTLKRTGHVKNYFTFYTESWAEQIKRTVSGEEKKKEKTEC